MFYRVERKSEKIYIIDEIDREEIYGVNQKDYIEITDEVIVERINTDIDKGLTVYFNTITKEIGSKVDKYRDIPNTDVKRVQALRTVRFMYESLTSDIDMIDYIAYIDANNVLNSKGFFVTDENREETYLDILEAGDEKIIDTLEEFLELKDKLSSIKSAKKEYDEAVEKIYSTSEDDIDLSTIS